MGIESAGGQEDVGIAQGVGKVCEIAGVGVPDVDFLQGDDIGIDTSEDGSGGEMFRGCGSLESKTDVVCGDPDLGAQDGDGQDRKKEKGGERSERHCE